MILHNLEAKEQGRMDDVLKEEEIIGCIITLQFASADTTKNLALNTLYWLGKNPDYQWKIVEECKKNKLSDETTGYFELDGSDFFNRFMKEILRLYGPGV